MVIWRNVIKSVFKASLSTVIIPVAVATLVIYYFGITINSLLAIIFLAQIYIIWAQLEVALRQTRLSILGYEPEFEIEVKRSGVITGGGKKVLYNAKLRNVGEHLARNVLIFTRVESADAKVPPMQISNLGSSGSVDVYSFSYEIYNNCRITIELNYENVLGELGGITFIKEPELPEFRVFRPVRMPGVLLNSFEELISLSRLFTFSRRIKKIRKNKHDENKKAKEA